MGYFEARFEDHLPCAVAMLPHRSSLLNYGPMRSPIQLNYICALSIY